MRAESLGERIRSKRILMGLTQEQLAEIMSVPKSTISAYENDKVDVKGSVIRDLSRFLHTSPNYILGYNDQMADDSELLMTAIALMKVIKDDKVLQMLLGQLKIAAEMYS